MLRCLIALSALSPLLAVAQKPSDERTVEQASELVPLCRQEVEARYVARDIPTYQWRASHHDRANTLHVDGLIRAGGEDVTVAGRIARGARVRYITVGITDPRLWSKPAIRSPRARALVGTIHREATRSVS
ncbi:hypothetical protein [Stenotrophomonas humi]|uniref:hypothetical protein n=1 Tax=Stenotrophomonas humi TaxID=405444 RepID=UPI00070DEE47|nr:hypothetical protein [Stenotrophomonas humi]